VSGET